MKRPSEITVDLSGCKDEGSLFECLWGTLNFPALYERSWRGLGENMFYDPEMRMPEVLKVKGFRSFSRISPITAERLESSLAEYVREDAHRKVHYEEETAQPREF